MESRACAGGLHAAGPEGFNPAERASGLHAADGPGRRPGEDRRGEGVGICAGQVHCGQLPAARVAGHSATLSPALRYGGEAGCLRFSARPGVVTGVPPA
jgi:hypothetical protein